MTFPIFSYHSLTFSTWHLQHFFNPKYFPTYHTYTVGVASHFSPLISKPKRRFTWWFPPVTWERHPPNVAVRPLVGMSSPSISDPWSRKIAWKSGIPKRMVQGSYQSSYQRWWNVKMHVWKFLPKKQQQKRHVFFYYYCKRTTHLEKQGLELLPYPPKVPNRRALQHPERSRWCSWQCYFLGWSLELSFFW